MRLTSWIDSLRRKLNNTAPRRRRRTASGQAERLEDRTLLSATTLWANGSLIITATTGEAITVTTDSSSNVRVEIDGVIDSSLPEVQATLVERIEITGGDGDNVINLIDVHATLFSFVDPISGATMPIVVNGGDGHDTITGSFDLDDLLIGDDGDDVINGGAGSNQLDGGDGNDQLTGGGGDDILIGEDGEDTLSGGSGDDTLTGGNGHDSLLGNSGDDSIEGGNGNDTIIGSSGDDTLHGNDGRDSISGGSGDDSLTGGLQADTLLGGSGDDTALGNDGNDRLEGGTGDDLLVGGYDRDTILGDAGDDKLNGQRHNDSMEGGAGDDTILGGHGSDYLRGNEDDDRLKGQGGNDTIIGQLGNDYLSGDTGRDLLDASKPMITIDNVRIDSEGDYGEQPATFTVTLQGAFTGTVSVDWATSDGNTTAGNDYIASDGILTWTVPGEQTLTVNVLGDTIDESDEENFFIDLTNPVGALIYDDLGEGRIVDDDDPSPASFAPAVCSGGSTLGAIAPLGVDHEAIRHPGVRHDHRLVEHGLHFFEFTSAVLNVVVELGTVVDETGDGLLHLLVLLLLCLQGLIVDNLRSSGLEPALAVMQPPRAEVPEARENVCHGIRPLTSTRRHRSTREIDCQSPLLVASSSRAPSAVLSITVPRSWHRAV